MEEKQEDIQVAKKVVFTMGSSRDDRKRKRLEIKTQSVFGHKEDGSKKARTTLLKACTRMDSSVFGRTGKSGSSHKELRNSLGIRPSK